MELRSQSKEKLTPTIKDKLANWKRTKKANLASMLVTQVSKGQTVPAVSPVAPLYGISTK
jgi:hypothetical protein